MAQTIVDAGANVCLFELEHHDPAFEYFSNRHVLAFKRGSHA
jgi:hypothetical protein